MRLPILLISVIIVTIAVVGSGVGILLMMPKSDPAKPIDELANSSTESKTEEPKPSKDRVAVLKELREFGELKPNDRTALDDLFPFLFGDDAEIRAMALQVLRRIAGVSGYDRTVLAKAIQSKRLEPQLYAALAYTKLPAPAESLERLREFLVAKEEGDGKHAELRIASLQAIANNKLDSVNNNRIIATVLQSLDDNVVPVAEEASKTLESLIYPVTLKKLEPLVAVVACTEEDWKKEAASRPAHLSHSPEYGRLLAAQILKRIVVDKANREGLLSYEWTRGLYFPLLKKPDPRLQSIAIEALRVWKRDAVECVRPAVKPYRGFEEADWKWKDEHYQGFLDLASYSKAQAVRLEAVTAIGEMGSRKGGRLKRLADLVLNQIVDVDAVEVLDQIATTDPDDSVRAAAAEAMMSLVRTEPRSSDLVILMKWFSKDKTATPANGRRDLKTTAIELLGEVIRVTKRTTPLVVPKIAADVAPLLVEALRQTTIAVGANDDLHLYALNALTELGPQIIDPKVVDPKAAIDATQIAIGLLNAVGPNANPIPDGQVVATKNIAEKLLRFTVWIHTDSGSGSGSVIAGGEQPLILTNHHVIRDAKTIRVIFPVLGINKEVIGSRQHYFDNEISLRKSRHFQDATVAFDKPLKDLAILKLTSLLPDGAFPVIRASIGAKTGQLLFSRGMSGVRDGSLWRYSDGKCRAVIANHVMNFRDGENVSANMIEHTCQINPGDSGSGVVNEAGELVAVNFASKTTSNNVNYALDISEVDQMIAKARGTKTIANPQPAEPSNNPIASSGKVQTAAIELLRALGTPTIRPLTKALAKNPCVEQFQWICQLLREFARRPDPAVRAELLSIAPLYLCRIGSESDSEEIREAASSTVAEIGGMEIVGQLKLLTIYSTIPGPKPHSGIRSWAVKTLGRLDPEKLFEIKEGKPVSKVKDVSEFLRDMHLFEKDGEINGLASNGQKNLTKPGVK